jgi:aryl-alcohol dehydrogenase-like predicted oxidoreductase
MIAESTPGEAVARVPLGRGGMTVSRIGFGTAPRYGLGTAERRLGAAGRAPEGMNQPRSR